MSRITPAMQSGWAGDIIESLQDTALSTGSVVGWLRSNLGHLNLLIRSSYILEEEDIVPEMTDIQSGIYNELYWCFWLKRKAKNTLGAANYDWIEISGAEQGTVRKVSDTQKAVTFQSMARDCDENLKNLIKQYKGGEFSSPRQITFNNRRSVPDNIYCVSDYCWTNPMTIVYEEQTEEL